MIRFCRAEADFSNLMLVRRELYSFVQGSLTVPDIQLVYRVRHGEYIGGYMALLWTGALHGRIITVSATQCNASCTTFCSMNHQGSPQALVSACPNPRLHISLFFVANAYSLFKAWSLPTEAGGVVVFGLASLTRVK